MKQHGGKNRHLEPEYFNMEMVLGFNLGPFHLLDGLIEDILSFDSKKSYIRKQAKISRVVTNDLNKSAAILFTSTVSVDLVNIR